MVNFTQQSSIEGRCHSDISDEGRTQTLGFITVGRVLIASIY